MIVKRRAVRDDARRVLRLSRCFLAELSDEVGKRVVPLSFDLRAQASCGLNARIRSETRCTPFRDPVSHASVELNASTKIPPPFVIFRCQSAGLF